MCMEASTAILRPKKPSNLGAPGRARRRGGAREGRRVAAIGGPRRGSAGPWPRCGLHRGAAASLGVAGARVPG
jgi:hypothetical protein